jgi:hypothetical protein
MNTWWWWEQTEDNFYPGVQNFPVVSFPQEVPPPLVDPDEGETMLVAYSPEWTAVLMAAVDQLLQYSSWVGDHDEKILAVNRATNLKIQLQQPVDVGEREYPAPYWDTEEDVDDEMPVEDQDWYGMVTNPGAPADELNFVENAVIWIISGFIALVLAPALPVGVAAAITFRTLATRFTLAFNRGDIGEQFRVIIDAADYEMVDTEGMSVGDIIEIAVDGLPDAAYHDIMIVRTVT